MNTRRYLKLVKKRYVIDIEEFSMIHLKRFISFILCFIPVIIGIFLICNYNDIVFTTYDASNVKNIVECKTTCKSGKLIETKVPYFLYKTPEPKNDHSHGRYYEFDGELKKTSGWFSKDVATQKINHVDDYNKETKTLVIKNISPFLLTMLYLIFWFSYIIFGVCHIILARPHQYSKPYHAYFLFHDYCYEDQKYYRIGIYKNNVKSTLNYILLYIKLFFNIPMTIQEIEGRLSLTHNFLHETDKLTKEELKEFNEIRIKYMENKLPAL